MHFAYNWSVADKHREPQDAVLDASFWINAERAGLAPYLLEYFSITAPPRVEAELMVLLGPGLDPPPAATLFAEWRRRGQIQIASPQQSFSRFDPGENEAIALAQERGWVLLIDNGAPRDFGRGPLGLRVVDSPAFAVLLYDQGRLTYAQTVAALHRTRAARRVVREALLLLTRLARRKGDTSS